MYIGLFAMAGFILYDTQAIMEKRRAGSTDCVKHSLDLFFDLATVFRRLLIILTQKVSVRGRGEILIFEFLTYNVVLFLQEERAQDRKRKQN